VIQPTPIKLTPKEATFAKQLIELGGSEKKFVDNGVGIIYQLKSKYGKCEPVIRSLLKALESKGVIAIAKGPNQSGRGRYMAVGLTILRDDIDSANENRVADPSKVRLIKPSDKPGTSPTSGNRVSGRTVAILIDFDNANISAEEAGFKFSPKKLNEYCRKFGAAKFRMAFLSPRSRGDISRHANLLNAAGYDSVLCPLYIKEKDSVDEILKEKVRQLLEYADVFVIVTADGDMRKDARFENQILDQGKKLEYIDVKSLARELAAEEDEASSPQESKRYKEFRDAIDIIMSGRCTLNQTEDINVKFICEAYDVAIKVADKTEMCFRDLLESTWKELPDHRKRMFRSDDLKTLLSALHHEDIFQAHRSFRFTYYKSNRQHPFPAKRAEYRFGSDNPTTRIR